MGSADMFLKRQKSEQHLHAHNARERQTEEDEKVQVRSSAAMIGANPSLISFFCGPNYQAVKTEEFNKDWSEVNRCGLVALQLMCHRQPNCSLCSLPQAREESGWLEGLSGGTRF